MSEPTDIYSILDSEGAQRSQLTSVDRDAVLAGHLKLVTDRSRKELDVYREALQPVLIQARRSGKNWTGQVVLDILDSIHQSSANQVAAIDIDAVGARCRRLGPLQFTIQTAEDIAAPSGSITRFTRANAAAGTLELTATTGEYGDDRWPSSEQFIFGFNRSQASIGGILAIPDRKEVAILTVSAALRIEHIRLDGQTVAQSASKLLHAISLMGSTLPLGGTALGWCKAGLSIHSAQGSARTAVQFVSKWANRNGSETRDNAPGGVIELSKTVIIGRQTTEVSIFLDLECFAGAEESREDFQTGFGSFECRNKPIGTINGIFVLPSWVRVQGVAVDLCELPVLSRSE